MCYSLARLIQGGALGLIGNARGRPFVPWLTTVSSGLLAAASPEFNRAQRQYFDRQALDLDFAIAIAIAIAKAKLLTTYLSCCCHCSGRGERRAPRTLANLLIVVRAATQLPRQTLRRSSVLLSCRRQLSTRVYGTLDYEDAGLPASYLESSPRRDSVRSWLAFRNERFKSA